MILVYALLVTSQKSKNEKFSSKAIINFDTTILKSTYSYLFIPIWKC